MPNHTQLLAMLEPTELRLYRTESDIVHFAQGEGYIQVGNNRVLVFVEEAHPPDELDRSDLEDRLRRAEEGIEQSEEDSEERRRHERDKKRYEAFLAIASGGSEAS